MVIPGTLHIKQASGSIMHDAPATTSDFTDTAKRQSQALLDTQDFGSPHSWGGEA
jgi:hypothetical protein